MPVHGYHVVRIVVANNLMLLQLHGGSISVVESLLLLGVLCIILGGNALFFALHFAVVVGMMRL